MSRPTLAQYQAFRAERREAVRRIVDCVQSGTIGMTDWARGVIRRARSDHSASVARQIKHGYEQDATLSASVRDISTITEYGLSQKLSNSIRCF